MPILTDEVRDKIKSGIYTGVKAVEEPEEVKKKKPWKFEGKTGLEHRIISRRRGYNPSEKRQAGQGVVSYAMQTKKPSQLLFKSHGWSKRWGSIQGTNIGKVLMNVKNGNVNLYMIHDDNGPLQITSANTRYDVLANAIYGSKLTSPSMAEITRSNRAIRKWAKLNGLDEKRIPLTKNGVVNVARLIYPALNDIDDEVIQQIKYMPVKLRKALKQNTFRKAIKKLFKKSGKTFFTTLCTKLQDEKSLEWLALVSQLQEVMNLDYLIMLNRVFYTNSQSRNCFQTDEQYQHNRRVEASGTYSAVSRHWDTATRDYLLTLPENRRLSFIMYAISGYNHATNLSDLSRMVMENPEVIPPDRMRDVYELHEFYSRELRKQSVSTFALPVHQSLITVAEEKFGENDKFQLVYPKTNRDLTNWSRIMNNCISGYATQVKSKSCTILGVLLDGKLKYNIQLSRGVVIQFYGARNSTPDNQEKLEVMTFLRDRNLLNPPLEKRPIKEFVLFDVKEATMEKGLQAIEANGEYDDYDPFADE